jgi:hypothetical protein
MIKLRNFWPNQRKDALRVLGYALIVLSFLFIIGLMLWPVMDFYTVHRH